MIKPSQLRFLTATILREFDITYGSGFCSPSAIELLMLTSAQETLCGHYLWQDNGDPDIERYLAYGIDQMEPIGYKQATKYLSTRHPMYHIPPRRHMIWDLRAATILARAYYASWTEALPEASDIWGLAAYYKKYWNTERGKATTDEAVKNYYRYAAERTS